MGQQEALEAAQAHQQELECRQERPQIENAVVVLRDLWHLLGDHQDVPLPASIMARVEAAIACRPHRRQFASTHQVRCIRDVLDRSGVSERAACERMGVTSLWALDSDRVLTLMAWVKWVAA